MKITVKLFASLTKDRFEKKIREYSPGTTAGFIIKDIGIEKEVSIIFINNRHAETGQELEEGDIIAFFPPVGGG
ncbi:MAG: MoaD/ThiS family protein [bacterium]|nr:MoaD/ThiS family protein [bacterium]